MAKNNLYKIKGLRSLVIAGGEQLAPNKDGHFELTEAGAAHLGTVYKVEAVADGKVIGDGRANDGGVKPKAEITKESLMALTNEDLDERLKACGLKVDKEASKGDKAEAILGFIAKLDQAAEKADRTKK